VRVIFQKNLPLADMKARLVVNRLAGRARIIATEPPVESLDQIELLEQFTITLSTDLAREEIYGFADVEGVVEVDVQETGANPVTLATTSGTVRDHEPGGQTDREGPSRQEIDNVGSAGKAFQSTSEVSTAPISSPTEGNASVPAALAVPAPV